MPTLLSNGADPQAPAAEEIQAAGLVRVRAAIGLNLGTPGPGVLARLLDVYGSALRPEEVFVFPGEISNNLVDTYGTYMRLSTLSNYVLEAGQGRALMVGHNYGGQAVGQSFNGRMETDPTTGLDIVHLELDPTQPNDLRRVFADYYLIRGLQLAEIANDSIIRAVETRSWRDLSVGFRDGAWICVICGLDTLHDWNCPHIPGLEYEVEGVRRPALAGIENGHLVESSFAFEGSNPETGVVAVKARMVAASGRLTAHDARGIAALEARLGQRLIDPMYHRKVRRVSAPPSSPEVLMPTKPAPAPARRPQGRDTTTPAAGDVSQVVADQATADSQALADHLQAVMDQVAAQETLVQGLTDQITALTNQVDDQGNPIDNTAEIAAVQTQLQAAQDALTALNADLTAAQAEHDAASTAADAAGGTSTPAPDPNAAGAAGAPAATTPAGQMGRALAAARQMAAWATTSLLPLRTGIALRQAAPDQRTALLVHLRQAADEVNRVLVAAGGPPARATDDAVVFTALNRHLGRPAHLRDVQLLIRQAKAGETYETDLCKQCEDARVRVLGAEGANLPHYRQILSGLDVDGLKAELVSYEKAAQQVWRAGRQVPLAGAAPAPNATPVSSADDPSLFPRGAQRRS